MRNKKTLKYKLSDAVIGRVVNILQEAMIAGVDVLDLFRQMQMRPADGDPHELVLTDEYRATVDKWHEEITKELEKRRDESEAASVAEANVNLIVGGQEDQGVIYGTGKVKTSGGVLNVDSIDIKKVN